MSIDMVPAREPFICYTQICSANYPAWTIYMYVYLVCKTDGNTFTFIQNNLNFRLQSHHNHHFYIQHHQSGFMCMCSCSSPFKGPLSAPPMKFMSCQCRGWNSMRLPLPRDTRRKWLLEHALPWASASTPQVPLLHSQIAKNTCTCKN